jgi:hypothetical protein
MVTEETVIVESNIPLSLHVMNVFSIALEDGSPEVNIIILSPTPDF